MENSEKQLRENIEVVIKWLKAHRPYMGGTTGPIFLLRDALNGVDLSGINLEPKQREEEPIRIVTDDKMTLGECLDFEEGFL